MENTYQEKTSNLEIKNSDKKHKLEGGIKFKIKSDFQPSGDQPEAIKKLLNYEISSTQKRIILVTSAFHMNRAKKIFEREGITVLPYPVDFKGSKSFFSLFRNPLNLIPSSFHLHKSSSAIREIIGRIIYQAW